jgi:hypothetical protein
VHHDELGRCDAYLTKDEHNAYIGDALRTMEKDDFIDRRGGVSTGSLLPN